MCAAQVALYNEAHKHYLHSDSAGKLLCHEAHAGEGTSWEIFKIGEHYALRNVRSGEWLHARDDGTFTAEGSQDSKFTIEHVRDGAVSIKAINTSWYLGISVFGHVEPIDSQTYDRAHWKVEVEL